MNNKTIKKLKILSVILILITVVFNYIPDYKSSSSNKNKKPITTTINLKATSKIQSQRLKFIENLKSNNIISKIEIPGNMPKVTVAPGYYSLSFDEKKTFFNAILAYYYTKSKKYDMMRIHDYYTGVQIARFDDMGLHIY